MRFSVRVCVTISPDRSLPLTLKKKTRSLSEFALRRSHRGEGAAAGPCRANSLHKESLCGAKSHTGVRDRRKEAGERERERQGR